MRGWMESRKDRSQGVVSSGTWSVNDVVKVPVASSVTIQVVTFSGNQTWLSHERSSIARSQ